MTLIPMDKEQEFYGMPDWFTTNREEDLKRWHDEMPQLPIWFEDFNEVSILFLMEELEGNP